MGMSPAARFLGFLCSMISCEVLFPAPHVLPKVSLNYEHQPVLKTVYGEVKGYYLTSIKGRNIASFEGIAYAEKPEGPLRFANPEKKKPWLEPRDGTKKGPICIQMDPFKYFNIQGEEDCLYLNVYIPQLDKDQLLPIVVFIHGGFFGFGSGNYYGPSYLLDEDAILVTFNYRLGPLGFVSSGDDSAPGNFGLKDQAMALGWVIENVDRMGGDRNRIVLMGHDAGGVASHLHMMSPLTQDLFGAAISQSGNGFSHWAFTNSKNLTRRLAEDFWCPVGVSKDMIKCLRGISAKKLVSQQYQLYEFMEYPTVLFGPVIEHNHEDAFIIQPPEMLYAKGLVKSKPWLTGITKDEGEIFPLINNLGLMGNRRFLKELHKAVPTALNIEADKTSLIEDFYLGEFAKKYSFDGSETVPHLSNNVSAFRRNAISVDDDEDHRILIFHTLPFLLDLREMRRSHHRNGDDEDDDIENNDLDWDDDSDNSTLIDLDEDWDRDVDLLKLFSNLIALMSLNQQ
ncbi:unnamed protein product [Orchesella dallaii]|uniref:Carboxylesterase type B domain-containing protein n=1 Tax=Orchesella dallaii TaxID=48710 RepID=A0ABP1Q734_9HEXA